MFRKQLVASPRRLELLAAAVPLAAAGLLILTTGAQETRRRPPRPDFATFEDAAEAARWKAVGKAEVAATRDFPSWQTHSLKVRVPAGASGGVETDYVPEDWHRFEALQFFTYAEAPASLEVEVRDARGGSARQQVEVKKGVNHVQVRNSGFKGVNLRRIDGLALHVQPPREGATLYLDRFRLTEYNEVLARFGKMDAPYGLDVETPHVKWARPYAGGPVHMLIVPDVAHGRAAVEIAQRLECRLDPVTLGASSGKNRWGFGDFYGQRGYSYGAPFTLAYTYLADRLLNGPEYDVMVLPGSRPWDEFPEIVRRKIRERVERGMGLVLIDPRVKDRKRAVDLWKLSALELLDAKPVPAGGRPWKAAADHFIIRNVPLDAFPYDQLSHRKSRALGTVLLRAGDNDPILAVRQVGKGRVVTAAWVQRGMIPLVENQWNTEATWRYWEYMYSLLARAIVWAAGKEPSAGLDSIGFDSSGGIRYAVVHAAAPAGSQVRTTVRDEFWETESTGLEKIERPGSEITVALPSPPRGVRHFVDVILQDAQGKVIDWGSATYTTRPATLVEDIEFSSDRFRLGEAVTGEVRLSGSLDGVHLRLRLYDNYGRLLREQRLSPSSAAVPFSLSSEGCLTRLARLDAEVLAGGKLRHRRRKEVFILQPRKWDHYDIVMYLFGTDPAPGLWDTVQQRLKEMYVTTLSSYPLELSKHANFGIQAQTRISGQESPDGEARKPYLERKRKYYETHDKKYLERLYCLNDPAYLEQERREIEKLVTPWVPFSPMSYYIYEEPSLTCYDDALDLCFSRYCMRKMRRWLQKEYGSLEALNRQWGTSFTRWDDVVPDTAEEAQKRGNYSSWADHRTFMEITYAANYAYVKRLLHEHDPDGLVLLSGTQSSAPHNGCDYSRLDFIVDHLNPYNHEGQLEFHRSFNPKIKLSGGSGYGVHGRRVLYNFYKNLFHGYWAGSYVFWQYSILNPDYRFCQSAKDIREGYRELVDGGIARLIRGAKRENFGIAIHYSYPSIHAAWIVDGRSFPPVGRGPNDLGTNWGPTGNKFRAVRDGWTSALEDLGLQYDYVSRQQIESGELLAKKFRVLILPFSLSLTDEEVAAIEKFVEAGGAVIADGQAGVMDGHARWLQAGSLDEVFGIRRPKPARQQEVASGEPEKALELAGGEALDQIDGAPVLIRRSYGKGTAVYLNYFLAHYVEHRREGTAKRERELIGRALAECGVRPPYRVLTAAGLPMENYELIPYRAGSGRLLGLIKENHYRVRTEAFQLTLDRIWHVYDVRAKRYLGETSVIRDTIRTAEPKLYALLPDRIGAVKISAGEARRGEPLRYRVKAGLPRGMETAIVVRVYRPGGRLAREYSETLETRSGEAAGSFPLALNDPAGKWKVVVTEALSGAKAALEFHLD